MHVQRKLQPTVIPALFQGLGDALHRFHFDPFSRPEVQAFHRRGLAAFARVLAEKHPAGFPKQPYSTALRHLQDVEIARTESAQVSCPFFPPREGMGGLRQFTSLSI